MNDQDLYSGLIRLHVLYHASKEPIFGLGMIRELRRHGYRVGPGTLYPILHRLEKKKYITSRHLSVGGKIRRSYKITARGRAALQPAREKVKELFEELFEDKESTVPGLHRGGEGATMEQSGSRAELPAARRAK